MTWDRATLTIERQQEVICALSHNDIYNDLDGPLTQFSRSGDFWSRMTQNTTKFLYNTNRKPYTIFEWCHFQWPWPTSDPDFKVTTIFKVEYRKTARLKLLHKRKLHLTYGMVLCLATLTDLSICVMEVCQHQLSFLFAWPYHWVF